MNVNPTTLKAAGYRGPYPQPGHGDFCRGLWQKTVQYGGRTPYRGVHHSKKKYFLSVLIWEFPNRPLSASVSVTFFQEGVLTHHASESEPHTSFDVELRLGPETTVEQMEDFYMNLYSTLDCIPDIHNND